MVFSTHANFQATVIRVINVKGVINYSTPFDRHTPTPVQISRVKWTNDISRTYKSQGRGTFQRQR